MSFLAHWPEFLLINKFHFIDKFMIQNWVESTGSSHKFLPAHKHNLPHSLWTLCTSVVHFLQSMNLHWQVIIIQSPWFTLEFTLGYISSFHHELNFLINFEPLLVLVFYLNRGTSNAFLRLRFSRLIKVLYKELLQPELGYAGLAKKFI